MTYIKLFGLQRSGTNVVKGLLELNYSGVIVLQSILGNKHKPFDREQALSWQPSEMDRRYMTMSMEEVELAKHSLRTGTMCTVLSIKNPYSWLVSYYRLRRLKDRTFMKWSPAYIKTTLPLWIRQNRRWLVDLRNEFGERLVINFYDETGVDAEPILKRMESCFALQRKGNLITSLPRATLRGNDSHFGETVMGEDDFDRNYYSQRLYRQRFTNRQKDIADSILKKAPGALRPYIIW